MARRALGPASLAVAQALEALVREERSLLVACSGGADSLALAAGVAHHARRRSLSYAAAAVVDHGLQDGSAGVAAAARDRLTDLGFGDVRVLTVRVGGGSGPEADARTARYAALDGLAADLGADLLLGHTLDDQAETVLLGLARGSGTRSLAGMAAYATGPAPHRVARRRPLLGLPRETTRRACTEQGLTWWDDPHNRDPAYARVRVRDRVLPVLEAEVGPGVVRALARTAALSRDDADLLDDLAGVLRRTVTPADAPATLGTDALRDQPPALRHRVLHGWLVDAGSPDLGRGHVLAVDALVVAWHGQAGVDVPGGRVVRDGGRLTWRPAVAG